MPGYCPGVLSADYRIGGVNPEALLCRPEGNGPFAAVVHNQNLLAKYIGLAVGREER